MKKKIPIEYLRELWDGIDRNGPVPDEAPHLGPCWIWKKGNIGHYGRVDFPNKHREGHGSMLVHRVMYQFFRGYIPLGMEVDHLCTVKRCCHPDHLEVVTCGENKRRAHARRILKERLGLLQKKERDHATITYCRNGHRKCPENNAGAHKYQCRRCRDEGLN